MSSPAGFEKVVVDYGVVLGGALGYLQRIGVLPALSRRLPGVSPADLRIHSLPQRTPLPLAELQHHVQGENPPDRGRSRGWPHPAS